MNRIYRDLVICVHKRLLIDAFAGIDVAEIIAGEIWHAITTTASRTVLRDTPALREALAMNHLDPEMRDADLRAHLRSEVNA